MGRERRREFHGVELGERVVHKLPSECEQHNDQEQQGYHGTRGRGNCQQHPGPECRREPFSGIPPGQEHLRLAQPGPERRVQQRQGRQRNQCWRELQRIEQYEEVGNGTDEPYGEQCKYLR